MQAGRHGSQRADSSLSDTVGSGEGEQRERWSLEHLLLCGRFPGLRSPPCHKTTPRKNNWGGGSQERPDFLISCYSSEGRSEK